MLIDPALRMSGSDKRRVWGSLPMAGAVLALGLAAQGTCAQTPRRGDRQSEAYQQILVERYTAHDPRIPPGVRRALAAPLRRTVRDPKGTVWEATSQGLAEISAFGQSAAGRKLWTGRDGLPQLKLDGIAEEPPAPGQHRARSLWLATHAGAILLSSPNVVVPSASPGERTFYFAGHRYLADDLVLGLAADARGAWIRTHDGVSRIEFRPYTLERKAAYFEDRLAERHLRNGFVDDCFMASPGDVAGCRAEPSDNDGLWTAIYVAAECFRYGATGSKEALERARASLNALLRLESVTATPGFPARAIAGPGELRDAGGEWHPAGAGSFWKGDTSSDELVGHFFADWVAYHLLPSGDDLRRRAAGEAERIAQRLRDHGLRLVGPDGRVTRWGDYTLEYFKTPEGAEDAGLDSLEILSHLHVAAEISGRPELRAAYRHTGLDLGYINKVSRFGEAPGEVNYSDEELAYLTFAPLLDALPADSGRSTGSEDDPALVARYRVTLHHFWNRTRDENNPLWAVIAAAALPRGEVELQGAREALERIPMDTLEWTADNSGRADISQRPRNNRFGRPQSTRALPPNERPVMKWNGDPFELEGGDGGRSEDDGAFFLLPYWMARYYGLIG